MMRHIAFLLTKVSVAPSAAVSAAVQIQDWRSRGRAAEVVSYVSRQNALAQVRILERAIFCLSGLCRLV